VSAATAFGVLYPAGLAAFLIPIRHGAFGPMSWAGAWLVFFPLVITWVCDTAAMFGGRAMGGPKLWPSVSPGKTWSGSLAGVAGALATVPVMNALVLERLGVALPLGQGLAFALALGILGQVGDLAESLYKREVGVKDSSALIPGHGGVLDRFDSLYFVLPVSAALYRLFGQL
jgi:phosphatidate cytidylyltransferase